MLKRRVVVLMMILFQGSQAAEMQTVLSGQGYDGISKTPFNDYLVTTGSDGGVVRFDDQGNTAVIYQNGTYTLSAFEDVEQNIYITDPAGQVILKDYFNGPLARIDESLSRVSEPGTVIEASFQNLYVSSLDDGSIKEILKLGPFVDVVVPAGQLSNARSLATDVDGNLYIANADTAEIFRLGDNNVLEVWATLPIQEGDMKIGHIHYQDNAIYVAGFQDNRLYHIDMDGLVTVIAGPGAQGDAGQFVFNGPLGLASGDEPYELYVTNNLGQSVVRVQLDEPGTASQAITESAGLSGLWFDPALDGEGYNVMLSAQGLLVIYYGYDAMGERQWLISDVYTEPLFFGQTIPLTLFQTSGGSFDMPAPPSDTIAEWGDIELIFENCTTGVFTMNGSDGEKTSMVQPLLNINGTECL